MRLSVVQGDITKLAVDAIVNAANETLLGGGGVDGAIHTAAGHELYSACQVLPEVAPEVRCPVGLARITPGFALPARFVIHTVGPIWRGGDQGEPELLAGCYRNSLLLACAYGLRSVAFPAISCGVYGYPVALACEVAVASVREFARAAGKADKPEPASSRTYPDEVLFVGFGSDVTAALNRSLAT